MSENETDFKVINTNRKAFFNYQFDEKIEAGICLLGTEIKAIRIQGCNLQESFIRIENGQAWVCQMEIPLYRFGNLQNHEPFRKRKLLLHRAQIRHLEVEEARNNMSCIPLRLFIKHGLAKIEIGIGKGKKQQDKRESLRKKSDEREMQRAVKYRK